MLELERHRMRPVADSEFLISDKIVVLRPYAYE